MICSGHFIGLFMFYAAMIPILIAIWVGVIVVILEAYRAYKND